MNFRNADVVIVGGGLSGTLLSLGIQHFFPRVTVQLIEQEKELTVKHTWSFHGSDIPSRLVPFLSPLISKSWDSHEVHFPEHHRILRSPYHSIRQLDLVQHLQKSSVQLQLGESAKELSANEVVLNSGKRVRGNLVVDARGWIEPSGACGYQKFIGLDVKLAQPHGLQHVRLMDARVPQIDGYRFMYVLPWSDTELLIEDTYYSNHPGLREERIEQEVLKYAREQGWQVEQVLRRERGCLPIPLTAASLRGTSLDPQLGARALNLHMVTGYTTPYVFRFLDRFLHTSSPSTENFLKVQKSLRLQTNSDLNFYLILNRMMFRASTNEQRYRVLQKFYRLPETVVRRFYSGELNWWDKARILSGKPPVPISRAIQAILNR